MYRTDVHRVDYFLNYQDRIQLYLVYDKKAVPYVKLSEWSYYLFLILYEYVLEYTNITDISTILHDQ